MKKILILLILCILMIRINAQNVSLPCFKSSIFTNVLIGKTVKTSSTKDGGIATYSNDGTITVSSSENNITKTNTEANSYWEADLGDKYVLRGIKIYFPNNTNSSNLKQYYILTSEVPFSDGNLYNQLEKPYI